MTSEAVPIDTISDAGEGQVDPILDDDQDKLVAVLPRRGSGGASSLAYSNQKTNNSRIEDSN